ncbi:uncharacterized protein [Pocillopora verrucosa]|uniref:uncharacterized protein n=1 Tax=Pocillopora verrucosa TaxID=203993 RepID=UPI00333F7B62
MAEGGGWPWSSRRRSHRERNDREAKDSDDLDRDLLRVVLSDSEDFVPEDVKSTSSVACSCASDFQEEHSSCNSSSEKSCPNLIDLDPELPSNSRSLRWLAKKVSRRRSSKESAKTSADKNRKSDRDENGLSYHARCLQEAKRVREKAELEALQRRTNPQVRRRRPLSLLGSRSAGKDGDGGFQGARRRRFSLSWGFRREDSNTEVVGDGYNAAVQTLRSPSLPREANQDCNQSNAISLEEFERRRKEKARMKAAQHKLEYFLINDIASITNCPWYWGKINRFEAEKVLEGLPDGTFLLRDSAQYHYLFSVSFRRYSRTYHARIEQWKHRYSFDKPSDYSFHSTSVCQLLQHYSRAEQCMYYEPLLLKPLHRRNPVSLQDLCRAVISSHTTFQGVSDLPLPNTLQIFLREFHYKVPVKRTEEKSTQTLAPRKRFSFSFHRD